MKCTYEKNGFFILRISGRIDFHRQGHEKREMKETSTEQNIERELQNEHNINLYLGIVGCRVNESR